MTRAVGGRRHMPSHAQASHHIVQLYAILEAQLIKLLLRFKESKEQGHLSWPGRRRHHQQQVGEALTVGSPQLLK